MLNPDVTTANPSPQVISNSKPICFSTWDKCGVAIGVIGFVGGLIFFSLGLSDTLHPQLFSHISVIGGGAVTILSGIALRKLYRAYKKSLESPINVPYIFRGQHPEIRINSSACVLKLMTELVQVVGAEVIEAWAQKHHFDPNDQESCENFIRLWGTCYGQYGIFLKEVCRDDCSSWEQYVKAFESEECYRYQLTECLRFFLEFHEATIKNFDVKAALGKLRSFPVQYSPQISICRLNCNSLIPRDRLSEDLKKLFRSMLKSKVAHQSGTILEFRLHFSDGRCHTTFLYYSFAEQTYVFADNPAAGGFLFSEKNEDTFFSDVAGHISSLYKPLLKQIDFYGFNIVRQGQQEGVCTQIPISAPK